MATAAQIRTQVDTALATAWAAIQTRQAAYLARRGRYWQGLATHTLLPADGLELPPDRLGTRPTDQPETWAEVGAMPAIMPMSLTIDVYDGPQGQGYCATVRVTIGLRVWTRAQQFGPEAWRAFGWRQE